jgi:type III restriction enzyme
MSARAAFDRENLKPFEGYSLEQLKKALKDKGEAFVSIEMTVKTRFGEYEVKGDLFTAKSYGEFLAKMPASSRRTSGKSASAEEKHFPPCRSTLFLWSS